MYILRIYIHFPSEWDFNISLTLLQFWLWIQGLDFFSGWDKERLGILSQMQSTCLFYNLKTACYSLLSLQFLNPQQKVNWEDVQCPVHPSPHNIIVLMTPSKPRECVTWHKTDASFQLNHPQNVLPNKIIKFFHHYFRLKEKWQAQATCRMTAETLRALRAELVSFRSREHWRSLSSKPEVTCSSLLPFSSLSVSYRPVGPFLLLHVPPSFLSRLFS